MSHITKLKQCDAWKLCNEIASSEFWSAVGISIDTERLMDSIKKLSVKGAAFFLIKTAVLNFM